MIIELIAGWNIIATMMIMRLKIEEISILTILDIEVCIIEWQDWDDLFEDGTE